MEVQQLKGAFMRTGITFLIAAFFIFALTIRWVHVWIFSLPIPASTGTSIAGSFIQAVKGILPQGTTLTVTNPLEAFTVTVGIAAAAGLLVAALFAFYEFWKFAKPGLYPHERKGLLILFLSSFALLYAGAQFGFSILTPAIYSGLYTFTPHNVLPLYSLGEVVGQVFGIMLASALSFLLPVLMVLLSASTLVPVSFWRSHWRHALFIVLVAAAVITPDGSGVSMVMLAVPLCALYLLGYAASAYVARARRMRRERTR